MEGNRATHRILSRVCPFPAGVRRPILGFPILDWTGPDLHNWNTYIQDLPEATCWHAERPEWRLPRRTMPAARTNYPWPSSPECLVAASTLRKPPPTKQADVGHYRDACQSNPPTLQPNHQAVPRFPNPKREPPAAGDGPTPSAHGCPPRRYDAAEVSIRH